MLADGTCAVKFVYISICDVCDWWTTNLGSTHKQDLHVTFKTNPIIKMDNVYIL